MKFISKLLDLLDEVIATGIQATMIYGISGDQIRHCAVELNGIWKFS